MEQSWLENSIYSLRIHWTTMKEAVSSADIHLLIKLFFSLLISRFYVKFMYLLKRFFCIKVCSYLLLRSVILRHGVALQCSFKSDNRNRKYTLTKQHGLNEKNLMHFQAGKLSVNFQYLLSWKPYCFIVGIYR